MKMPFSVESGINLLATSLGIKKEDKFRRYIRRADAAPYIYVSSFSRSLIDQTVKEVLNSHA